MLVPIKFVYGFGTIAEYMLECDMWMMLLGGGRDIEIPYASSLR
jgi:hypothetical protein